MCPHLVPSASLICRLVVGCVLSTVGSWVAAVPAAAELLDDGVWSCLTSGVGLTENKLEKFSISISEPAN